MRTKLALGLGLLLVAILAAGLAIHSGRVLASLNPYPPVREAWITWEGPLPDVTLLGRRGGVCQGQTPSSVSAIITVDGVLDPGTLGVPGEAITWIISVSNPGTLPASGMVVTDTLHEGLRIEQVITQRGDAVVSGQTVVFTVPILYPGETVQMQVRTMIVYSPANGRMINQVTLAVDSSDGAFATSAVGELFLPTGLPSTGYPPDEALPGEGEPSALVIGLVAFGVVALVALFVWYRGQRPVVFRP